MRRIATAAVVAALSLLAPGAIPAASAAPPAPPRLADAHARAAVLRLQVDRLSTAAELATEDYDAAQTQVADIVTQHLLAQRQLADMRATSAGDHQAANDRVRALYMTGGSAGLVSTVLAAQSWGDAVDRLHTVRSLVGEDRSRVSAAAGVTRQAAAIEGRLAGLTTQKFTAEKKAADAAVRVTAALAAGRQLLSQANAAVRRIAEEERLAAQAAAARAFAARLAAAQAADRAAARQAQATWAAGQTATLGPPRSGVMGRSTAPRPLGAQAAAAVAAARTRLGAPYVWGATGPDSFDCSGLTGWAYLQAGMHLPRTSRQQWWSGSRVELADLTAGDLLFWATDPAQPSSIHHVALYIGGGLMIAAPQPGEQVKIQPVYLTGYAGAVRPGV